MKLRKIFFILIILSASFQICFGQEKSKAILIDDFSVLPCDDFMSGVDRLMAKLAGNPALQGYVSISGKNSALRRKVSHELLIKGQVEYRKFDKSRINFIRGEDSENLRTQLWINPEGAEEPDFKEAAWNFVFPSQTKPFLFLSDHDEVCPETPFETAYAEYLNANPQARGHVVIYAKSGKKFDRFKEDALNKLNNISTDRLRFSRVKRERSENYANIEYWLVP